MKMFPLRNSEEAIKYYERFFIIILTFNLTNHLAHPLV